MMRFITYTFVGALVLALAGCGSSSDRADPPAATAAATAAEMLEEAKTTLTAAQAAVMAVSATSTVAELEAHQAAQRAVVTAANALIVQLGSDAGPYDEVAMVKADIAAAMAAITTAGGMITALNTAATTRMTAITEAQTELMAAHAAVKAISATSTVAEIEAHQAAQEAVVTAANDLVTALKAEPTSDMAVITAAETAATTADAAAKVAMARLGTNDAVALVTALNKLDATDNATSGPKGGAKAPFHSPTAGANYLVPISRKRANTDAAAPSASVKVSYQGGTTSPVSTEDDVPLTAGDAPPATAAAGWHGAGFTRGATEAVTIYTDIKAPTQIPFFMVDSDGNDVTVGNNGGRYAHAVDSTADLDGDVLTGYDGREAFTFVEAPIVGGAVSSDEAAILAHLKAKWTGSFQKSSKVGDVHTANFRATEAANIVLSAEGNAIKGYFDGAPGTFVCQTTICEISSNHKGQVVETNGQWVFVPSAGIMAVVDVLDVDYLHFGYWLKTTANDDGTSSYAFQATSGGHMAYGGDADEAVQLLMAEVVGTAKYTGAAGGMYMQKELKPDGTFSVTADNATSGMFTAKATLEANFKGPAVADDDQFSISGMVSDFMDGDTNLGWTAKLMSASFVVRDADGRIASTPNHRNTFNGLTEGGSSDLDHGQWRGMFYGPSGDDTATVAPDDKMQPSGVSGEFNAHFTNGHVHGAFGATR